MEDVYNARRRRSGLGYLTPAELEATHAAESEAAEA